MQEMRGREGELIEEEEGKCCPANSEVLHDVYLHHGLCTLILPVHWP